MLVFYSKYKEIWDQGPQYPYFQTQPCAWDWVSELSELPFKMLVSPQSLCRVLRYLILVKLGTSKM